MFKRIWKWLIYNFCCEEEIVEDEAEVFNNEYKMKMEEGMTE